MWFTLKQVIIIFLLGCCTGIFFMAITDLLTVKHGKWKYGRVWYAENNNGFIFRAQHQHPAKVIKDTERIYQASRGE